MPTTAAATFCSAMRISNPSAINGGRYISSDPIGIAGGLNTFNYADVNPVMNIDPRGNTTMVLTGGGVATVACLANPVCAAAVAAGSLAFVTGVGVAYVAAWT